MGYHRGPNIDTDNLLIALDAGSKRSYSGTGTTFTNLMGGSYDGTIVGSPTFNSGVDAHFVLDGSTDWISFSNIDEIELTEVTLSLWFKMDQLATSDDMLFSIGFLSVLSSKRSFLPFLSLMVSYD